MKKKILSLLIVAPMLFTTGNITQAEENSKVIGGGKSTQQFPKVDIDVMNSNHITLQGETPEGVQRGATDIIWKLADTQWEYKGYALLDINNLGWGYRNSITITETETYNVGLSGFGLSGSASISYAFGETKNTRPNYLSSIGTFGELWKAKRTYKKYLQNGQYIGSEVYNSLEAWATVKLPVYNDNGWLWYDWPEDGKWYWAYNLSNGGLEYAKLSRWR
ncbi:hypothetical protein AAIE21_15320 [Paenibacillus sp. 102]|uniref:hypothetical protein n=1 Tax=Paenibacillus sp. 102 TaxID=3120823 RepID=UPI0031BB65CF